MAEPPAREAPSIAGYNANFEFKELRSFAEQNEEDELLGE
jgi:hypothetical protein